MNNSWHPVPEPDPEPADWTSERLQTAGADAHPGFLPDAAQQGPSGPGNEQADPAATDGLPSEGSRRPARTATIVWGLLVMAVGALLLVWLLTDIRFDPLVVLLGLIIGTGTALLIGGVVSAAGGARQRRSGGAAQ